MLPEGSGVLAQPRLQALKPELVRFVKPDQELISLKVIEFQPKSVDPQEGGSDGKGRALVSINKRVVLGKALKKRGRLFDDVLVISALRPGQGCFKRSERDPSSDSG